MYTHTAFKMLGEVTREETIKNLVEDLLGQSGLQEWETYHHAASHKVPDATKQELWSQNLSQGSAKSSSSQSMEAQENPRKKLRQESGVVSLQDQVSDPGDQGASS